jgi:hypothetical protein
MPMAMLIVDGRTGAKIVDFRANLQNAEDEHRV